MELRKKILEMAKRSYEEALFAGTSGNLSYYDRETGEMYITPSSVPYETMTADELVRMTLDGQILEGEKKPSSEWRMHAEVYRQKPEVSAVIHTHSPYATSFAVNHQKLPVILIEMVPFLGGDVDVADFAIPGTVEVGIEAVKKLQDRHACLMANHGVLAVGKDLEQAHIRAVYVEDAAKIYSLALSNGDVKVIDSQHVNYMKNR
ncbi:MAG: class II aldolase/adducin family protein [Lachnospiraceae bacterium]|nr:class II aldolase/adducin family protein [Lachnospiraceae bacterium]